MKKFKWPLVLFVLLLLSYFGYNYIYQGHRNIEQETAQHVITSKDLIAEFKTDAVLAETKYLNKTIEVSGIISEVTATEITLDDYIFSTFKESLDRNESKINETIIIKGRCIGYDDLLEQIKLDQCTIKK